MLKLLIEKEIKGILLSPKFSVTFGICTVLLLLSVYTGIREYEGAVRQYEAATQLADQEMREASSWGGFGTRTYRRPTPLQIFTAGVHYDVGRMSNIDRMRPVKLQNSPYSDDPIFAVFRFLDFTFIVQVVLSLLAVLFTYDAICGERKAGTLQLTFAHPVPRSTYLAAKGIGAWLGLVVPLLVPLALTVLLLLVMGVPLSGPEWVRLALLLGASVLYFTCFLMVGLLVSALVREPAGAFLILLVGWVTLVLIVPRAGVMLAGQLVPVPSVSELESQRDGFANATWNAYSEELSRRWLARSTQMNSMTEAEEQAYRDNNEWAWMQEDDALRRDIEAEIATFGRKLEEDFRNRRAAQAQWAFVLSRFSPASAYQLAAMHLAGTDVHLKTRFEDALFTYRDAFAAHVTREAEASGGGGIQISMTSRNGEASFSVERAKQDAALDLKGLPTYTPPVQRLREAVRTALPDLGLLALLSMLAFAGAFVAFMRYDVRPT